jgi:thymidine kinase
MATSAQTSRPRPITQPQPGRLEVITGPMFSGKTEELIRRLTRAQIARLSVATFKPKLDQRYRTDAIASHSAQTIDAQAVPDVEHLRAALLPQSERVDVVGIDEVQFFDDALVTLAVEFVSRGKRVIVAGLDMTFAGQAFPPIPSLMAIADEVLKLSAVCMVCGAPAVHSQRLGTNQELVVVGAAGVYEARCRACFRPEGDVPAAERLALLRKQ